MRDLKILRESEMRVDNGEIEVGKPELELLEEMVVVVGFWQHQYVLLLNPINGLRDRCANY